MWMSAGATNCCIHYYYLIYCLCVLMCGSKLICLNWVGAGASTSRCGENSEADAGGSC